PSTSRARKSSVRLRRFTHSLRSHGHDIRYSMPLSRLGTQIAQVAAALNAMGIRFALIGGLALASHKVVRATQDVDLLVEAEKADEIDAELARLGYRCLHRSAEAANYARADERIDFLYAVRPIARRLL